MDLKSIYSIDIYGNRSPHSLLDFAALVYRIITNISTSPAFAYEATLLREEFDDLVRLIETVPDDNPHDALVHINAFFTFKERVQEAGDRFCATEAQSK